MAGCGGSFLYSLCITISVTVITYNIIVSSNTTLSSGFPTSRKTLAPPALSDPVIWMPVDRASSAPRRPFHTAVTSSDSLYNTWQSRVMYYWFKKARAAAGPGSEMGGFTRILHSGKPDRFMDEIPTFVADPLPPGSDQSRSLFLKNLNFKTNDDSLIEHFSGKIRKGSIRSVKILKTRRLSSMEESACFIMQPSMSMMHATWLIQCWRHKINTSISTLRVKYTLFQIWTHRWCEVVLLL